MITELDSSDELEEALAAIAARLGEPGDAKERLCADRAVFDPIGAAGRCSRDAGRKALRKSQPEGGEWWERFVDHRQIITATPQRPGTRRLFLDIEELERRYPGAWAKRRD